MRNPVIADVLYMRKSIETWGRGLGVIAKECKRTGLPPPSTVVRGGYVVTTFKRPVILGSGSNLDRRDPDLIQIDPDSDNSLNSRLLAAMRLNPLISRKLLAEELKISERKVREIIGSLRKNDIVIRQGPEHGGIWRISKVIAHLPEDTSNGETNGDINGDIKRQLANAIQSAPGMKREKLHDLLHIPYRTLDRLIATLISDGIVEYRGSKKTGGYHSVQRGMPPCPCVKNIQRPNP